MDRKPIPWWVSVLAALVALFFIVQPAAGDRVTSVGSQALAPFSFLASNAAGSVAEFWHTIESIGTLRKTTEQQKEEIDRLNFEMVRMRELEQENQDLRNLLGFKSTRPNLQLLPVQVLGTDATGLINTIIIDKGSTDGIREDMAVITWRGLAGRVIRVEPTTAFVLLVTDVSSSVAARTQDPNSRASGIVGGRKEGGLTMKHILQQELIQTGDLVITSGVGGSLPEGLPIGKVVRVQKRNIEMFQEAILEPAVDTSKLERLYVVVSDSNSK
ncbi:MAG TPA: rod shape-determining protein MreC [Chloroflexota bacterium]|nr:rod shape-determining protein MreC [Chloroflexota bacterium]